MNAIIAVFVSVFIAELGDKTQLATLLFTAEGKVKAWQVFVASGSALLLSTAIAVFVGSFAKEYLANVPLKLIAGLGFIAIGIWTLYGYFKS